MLLIILLALASSGLVAQAQLPSNLSPVKAGFASEISPQVVGKIRIIQTAGEYDVVLHTPSNGTSQMSVFKKTVFVLAVKDGDTILGGHVINPPNQSTRTSISTDGKHILFSAWCNPRPVGPITLYSICSSYTADVGTKKITRTIGIGDGLTQANSIFGGSIQKPIVSEIRGTPVKNGDKFYVSLVIKDQSNVSYGGVYELKSHPSGGWQATGLVGDTSPGHYFITGEPVMSVDGKKIVYNDSRANASQTNDIIRSYDLTTKKIEVLFSSGDRVGSEILSGGFSNRFDPANKFNFLTSTSGSGTMVKLDSDGPKVLYSSFSNKLDGKVVSTVGMPSSNGLASLAYRLGSRTNWWEHDGIAIASGQTLISVLSPGDVVNASSVSGLGDQVAPHTCSVTGIDLDASSRLYRRLITVFPVLISRLTASQDGLTARMGGCGFNLEGLPLDSVTIGGATAEVVGRETDANGQDVLVLRPLSPVYAGMTEVAVTINGRRFSNTLEVSGGAERIKARVVNSASGLESPLAPQTFATLLATMTGKVAQAGASSVSILGGAGITVCGTAARLFYNTGTQINFLIPKDIELGKTCDIVLSIDTHEVARTQVKIVEFAPAMFMFASKKLPSGELDNSSTLPLATLTNGKLVGPGDTDVVTVPATEGQEIILWPTGLGYTFPEVNDMLNVPTNELFKCFERSTDSERRLVVKIGGVPAEVTYCGLVPGQAPGFYQVNVRIPYGTLAGENYLWIGEDENGNPISPVYKIWTTSSSENVNSPTDSSPSAEN